MGLGFCQTYFCIYWDDHVIFALHSTDMVEHIDWHSYIESTWLSWGKSRNVLDLISCCTLLVFCWGFYVYIHKSVVSFSCNIFAWIILSSYKSCEVLSPLTFCLRTISVQLVLFSRSLMSDSLWPHGLKHARPPCPSPTPKACSNSCPSSQWCYTTISSSVVPFSSCLQSFPAPGSFPRSQFFASGGLGIGVSASASVLPMNIQNWFPFGLTGWIFLQSKGLSRVFSNITVQKHQFFGS